MDKIGIVILNYLNYKDTIECIDSLQDDVYQNKEIIIVDNKSNNESWDVLCKLYKNKARIHLIQSNENIGFAKGNNIGIVYARTKLKCDHILIVNNDTIFNDKKMIEKLVNAYEKDIGIIGPDIISADNKHQNPVNKKVTKKRIEKDLNYYKYGYKGSISSRIINKIYTIIQKKNKIYNSTDLVMHGSCMLLTKDYFKYYPYIFPNTFLYYEEDILSLITKKVNLRKKYVKDAYIYHKEDQSSEMSFGNKESTKNKFIVDSINECKKLFDLSYEEIKERYFLDERN